MTRLPAPSPDTLSAADLSIVESMRAREGAYGAATAGDWHIYSDALLNCPPLAELVLAFRDFNHRELAPYHRNLVIMVIAAEFDSGFLFHGHMGDAIDSGVRPELIKALLDDTVEDELEGEELLLVRYIRQVLRRSVTDESFEQVRALVGPRQAILMTFQVGWIASGAMVMAAVDMPTYTAEQTLAQLDEIAAAIEEGRPVGDWLSTGADEYVADSADQQRGS